MQKEFEGKDKQIGVLITNLGTPDSPTKQGLKKYLNQFECVGLEIFKNHSQIGSLGPKVRAKKKKPTYR